jgi:hypothetical protein
MLLAQRAGRVQAFGGVGGRHADVDDRDVRRVLPHALEQRGRVADARGDREPRLDEQPGHAFPEEHGVVGDHHPQGLPGFHATSRFVGMVGDAGEGYPRTGRLSPEGA